ncbi:MAG: rod shape-determining protein RodA [Monoglobales bacterium]
MFRNLKKLLSSADTSIIVLASLLSVFGIIMIASATKSYDSGLKHVIVQSGAFIIGLFLMLVILSLDYERFKEKPVLWYFLCVCMLLFVLAFGQEESGTKGWIRFAGTGIQPSELVKIGFAVTFARHLESAGDSINRPLPFIGLLLHAGVLIGLVLLQPDYGTAMVYIFMFICMIFAAGIKYRILFSFAGIFALFAPLAWFFILMDFQKNRILSFLNPESDPAGAGYQVMQSKIAIGSGEFFGNGIFSGTQTQLGILPAKHTDFIFGVIGEELGFIGCFAVIAILIAIVIKCFYVGMNARTDYGKYLCIGIGAMLLFQIFENIGMCLGVMPVTGIPLPFLSYGGSSMLTGMTALGFVLSVSARQNVINF